MNIKLPDKVKYILQKLYDNNFDAYAVGGCVRDSILGREPGDWDITTEALPENTREIFGEKNTVPTGIKYGTVTVLLGGEGFEVTTYRVDMGYSDGRRPDEVRFTPSLEEELARRDFTINAMAFNEKRGLIDLFGGREDIQKRIIRCVGNPDERFSEDALRMMRAVRFAAQLGFDIESDTFKSIRKNSTLLGKVSVERINVELSKTLSSDNPSKVELIFDSGLVEQIIPEAAGIYNTPGGKETLGRTISVIQKLKKCVYLRMAVLLNSIIPECDEKAVSGILKRLKFDNHTSYRVVKLIKYLGSDIASDKKSIRRWLSLVGPEIFRDLLHIKAAYTGTDTANGELAIVLGEAERLLDEILNSNECYTIGALAVNGKDLINLGLSGKEIGDALKWLLDMVIEDSNLNARETLMERIRTGWRVL